MAIYGLNFNRTPIPEAYKKRFAARRRFDVRGDQVWFSLQGVCNTPAEADAMADQAWNGTREIRQVVRKDLHAIYCY